MTLHFAQLSGTLIRIESRHIWTISTTAGFRVNRLMESGCSHGNSTQPFTTPTYPLPLLFLLPLTSVLSLRTFGAPLQKSSTRFFSFRPFQNKGAFVWLQWNCTIPATRCNPILPLISKRSRLPNPAVRDRMATLVGATGSKVRFAGNTEVEQ